MLGIILHIGDAAKQRGDGQDIAGREGEHLARSIRRNRLTTVGHSIDLFLKKRSIVGLTRRGRRDDKRLCILVYRQCSVDVADFIVASHIRISAVAFDDSGRGHVVAMADFGLRTGNRDRSHIVICSQYRRIVTITVIRKSRAIVILRVGVGGNGNGLLGDNKGIHCLRDIKLGRDIVIVGIPNHRCAGDFIRIFARIVLHARSGTHTAFINMECHRCGASADNNIFRIFSGHKARQRIIHTVVCSLFSF